VLYLAVHVSDLQASDLCGPPSAPSLCPFFLRTLCPVDAPTCSFPSYIDVFSAPSWSLSLPLSLRDHALWLLGVFPHSYSPALTSAPSVPLRGVGRRLLAWHVFTPWLIGPLSADASRSIFAAHLGQSFPFFFCWFEPRRVPDSPIPAWCADPLTSFLSCFLNRRYPSPCTPLAPPDLRDRGFAAGTQNQKPPTTPQRVQDGPE